MIITAHKQWSTQRNLRVEIGVSTPRLAVGEFHSRWLPELFNSSELSSSTVIHALEAAIGALSCIEDGVRVWNVRTDGGRFWSTGFGSAVLMELPALWPAERFRRNVSLS